LILGLKMLISYPVCCQAGLEMAKTGTSCFVLDNPELFENSLQSLMRLSKEGLLVWRVSQHNQKRFEAFPSGEIKTKEDFEFKVGRRLAGVTVGYPTDTPEKNRHLWLRITDGTGQQHYIEYHDAPTLELKSLVKQLYNLAKSECGKGSVTAMSLCG